MSALGAHKQFISIEDYLAGEADGEQRHDFIGGRVYAMTGASRRHGLIASALAYAMTPAARNKGCQLFVADMKVRVDIADTTSFYYPDLLLSCEPQDRETYYSKAPCLIVEVLSPPPPALTAARSCWPTRPCPVCRATCWWSRT